MTDDYREDDDDRDDDDEEEEDDDDDREDDEEVLQCWLPGRLHGSTTRRTEIQRFLELGQAEPLQCISARIWSVPYGWGQQPGQPPDSLKRGRLGPRRRVDDDDTLRVPTTFVLRYTLRASRLELGGVDLDLAVEDDVLPLDRADMTQQVGVEREVGRGGQP